MGLVGEGCGMSAKSEKGVKRGGGGEGRVPARVCV